MQPAKAQSCCLSLKYSMSVKLLTKHHLEFLSLKVGCPGSSESTHVKCHIVGKFIAAQMIIRIYRECEGGIEKSVWMIVGWHHEACLVLAS